MAYYKVEIDPASLNTVAPSDGFIDPTLGNLYGGYKTYQAANASPSVVAGSTFSLNDVMITVDGTNNAAIVDAINAFTYAHRFVASVVSNKVTLTATPFYEYLVPVFKSRDDSGIVETVGLDNLEVVLIHDRPSTLALAKAKARANTRWTDVVAQLTYIMTCDVFFTTIHDGTQDTAPTALEFIIYTPDDVRGFDFDDTRIFGVTAIQVAVAKSLMISSTRYVTYYDPTLVNVTQPQGEVTDNLSTGSLTSSESTALSAVTVTPITIG